MQSIVIRIDPKLLVNAEADLRYDIPDRLSVTSSGSIRDNGFDYEPDTNAMHIYLATEDAQAALPLVIDLIESNTLNESNLPRAVRIGVSNRGVAESSAYEVVYPTASSETISTIP